jgi:hypothetical protein
MFWDYGKKRRLIDAKEGIITLSQQLDYNEATTQILVENERLQAVGGFDESFVACQDYDLWTRLMIKYGDAYRINDASYIINDTASTERLIGNPKSVKGYEQYFEKHHLLMSKVNIKNQNFMKLRRKKERMPFIMLLKQLNSGHLIAKIRYFLSSNFNFIKRTHHFLYRK